LVAGTALVASVILAPTMALLPRLGLAIGAGLIPASLMPLIGRSLKRTPLATWGMAIAHFGMAVAVIGMASDSALTVEKLAVAKPGDRIEVGPWLVEFASVDPVAGPNWTAIEAELRATRGEGIKILHPQARTFTAPPTETTESAIATVWNGQLYTVLGKARGAGWQLRLWWKPFVTLIWLGGALVALGGAVALVGRLWRRGEPRPERDWRRERYA
jgi:cytochrome c-type biogenesis protein CcmF